MLTTPRFSSLLIHQAGLVQSRTRCLKILPSPRLLNQITRLASTSTTQLSKILESSVVNVGTASQITVPRIIYSTSWHKEKTADLVYQALSAGYRGIETGAEPLRYDEKAAGEGIRKAIDEGRVERKELYIQTTFAPPEGQNLHSLPVSEQGEEALKQALETIPYSMAASVSQQIHSSIASSLKNLKASGDERDTYIDCLILSSPYPTEAETKEAWDVLSTYVPHSIRSLGIANKTLKSIGEDDIGQNQEQHGVSDQNESEQNEEKILPSVYTNRYQNHHGKDVGFQNFQPSKTDMVFQSFWTKDAMPQIANGPLAHEICAILDEVGYPQGESRNLAIYALLLALREHRIAILDRTTHAKKIKTLMRALKALEKWSIKKGKQRWGEVERAAKRLFKDIGWDIDERDSIGGRREVHTNMRITNPMPQDIYEIMSTSNRIPQDPPINEITSSALDPIDSHSSSDELPINTNTNTDTDIDTNTNTRINIQRSVKENSAVRYQKNRKIREKLLREGATPQMILEEIKRQRIEGARIRKMEGARIRYREGRIGDSWRVGGVGGSWSDGLGGEVLFGLGDRGVERGLSGRSDGCEGLGYLM
ncbi:0be1120a-1128-4cd7-92a9-410d3a76811c [Sclerotinia trifoliorum]|uniref:0be1120a-1128-4cd7-92a9-410d3a76811c n=1 Tax=Sclerotinia trifoliorum TaxID=28548 RepID=A0A8H2ZNN4_9HELO|nr:0be1120a-1128-4cd7-92a9-410d3a76811c [Sclerotinia trifoliorum]